MIEKEIYFADIETSAFKDDLDYESIDFVDFKLACCIKLNKTFDSIETYHSFESLDEMIHFFIQKSKSQKIFYFHNLSFDSKIFITQLYKLDLFDIEIIKIQSKILQISIFKKNVKKRKILIKFIDSLSLLLKSIKDLGNMVNLPKLEFDFDYSNKEQLEKAKEYCLRDSEIIYRAFLKVIAFVKEVFNIELTIDTLPLTIGSLAKKCFISIYPNAYQKHNIYFDVDNTRDYYFGGRVEVFDFEKENSECYDVNSEYPYTFRKYKFANSQVLKIHIKNESDYSIYEFMNDKNALALECEIIEKDLDIPFYPIKYYENKNNYKVYFCLGKKKVLMTKADIRFFVWNKYLDSHIIISRIKTLYKCANITNFKRYVNPLYKKKITYPKESAFNYFCKIFLNSSYGKFGQSIERDKFILHSNIDNIDLSESEIYIENNMFVERISYVQSFQNDNLLNAILTTSYGRLELYKWIMRFKAKGYKIKYCDSDSVFVKKDDSLPRMIKLNDNLGSIKLEYVALNFQGIDSKEYHCDAFNPKSQKNEFKLKHKGLQIKKMKKKAQLKEYYEKGIHNLIIPTMFYCLNRHTSINATFTIKKNKRSYYYKREINSDLSTKPIDLDTTDFSYKISNQEIIQKIISKI